MKIEFIDCIICITKDTIYFLGAPEKVKVFNFLEDSFKKNGKKLILFEKIKNETKSSISKFLLALKTQGHFRLGVI